MSVLLDIVQMTLALGAGWLGLVLMRLARSTPRRAHKPATRPVRTPQPRPLTSLER